MAMQSTAAQQAREASSRVERVTPKARPSIDVFRRLACLFVLVLSDLLAVALALELAILARVDWLTSLPKEGFSFSHYISQGWIWPVYLFFYLVEGLYTRRRTLWNEVGQLTKATSLGTMAVLAAVALGKLSINTSRVTLLLTGIILLVLMPVVRYWTKRLLGYLNLWRKPILILGATDTAHLVLRGIKGDPILGYHAIGLLDDDPSKQNKCLGSRFAPPVRVLGPLSLAPTLMREGRAKDIVLAMPELDETKVVELVHSLQSLCESIYVVPKIWGLPMMNLQVYGFIRERVMMLKLSNNLAKPWNDWLKRGFDLLLGLVLALLSFPFMLIIALLIKMDSPGPAFFRQERLGHRGKIFRCLKFRTMRIDGEEWFARYLKATPRAAEEWDKYAKLRAYDPRLTRLGRFLRRWSIDELPQIVNVLKGEMSLVGPRPYLPQEEPRICIHLPIILSARPGLTGFWQVNGRNHITFENRVQLEVWYVRNWTPWLDCIILAKTLRTVLMPHHRDEAEEESISLH